MFQIPSLADLVARARAAFRSYLPGSDAWLWPNNINPTAKAAAGSAHEIFGFADYIAKQKFAGTADSENLDLHGQEFGLARRPARPAYGNITLTVADAVSVIDGATFLRADGMIYIATAAASIGGAGTLTFPAVAAIDGTAANANAGTALEILSGVTDSNGDAGPLAAVADGGIVGGADVEPDGDLWTTDLSTFRGRILFRKRNPPHGGCPADYVQWAASQSGVTRVFVERKWNGPGTVRVFPLMDDLYANGIASGGDIARIADYLATVQPAAADVTVAAPAAVPVDIQIQGLTPDTADVRNAVIAELVGTFRRLSAVAGSDTPIAGMPYLAVPISFSRSWIWQAVANAAGEQRHSIVSPGADVVLSTGQIATLGNITFV